MNMYRVIGDAIATAEARELAEQLVAWHDAMVKHLRAVTLRGVACGDGCPHEQARLLWPQALDLFGDDAARLAFLRTHGSVPPSAMTAVRAEARA
jgi:hypothetical protein